VQKWWAGVALAGLAVSGCSKSADVDKLKKAILVEARSAFPSVDIGEVTCPDDIELGADNDFTCTLDMEGQPLTIEVDQTDDKGHVNIQQREAVIDLAKAVDVIGSQLSDQIGASATVDCGTDHFRIADVGSTFTCQASDANGQTATVKVTVKDNSGNVSWELAK
jgi:hypothetical protein